MLERCVLCDGIIWPFPWVRLGFWIRNDGTMAKWHRRCGQ